MWRPDRVAFRVGDRIEFYTMLDRKSYLPAALFGCVAGMLLMGTASARAANLPPGFAETQVATGLNPTTMAFAPDGRLFLCEKHGVLRVVRDGKLLTQPFLDLTDKIDSWNERGLLSVCFDPDFESNGWVYVYYTHNRDPKDTRHTSSNNRVSRFTAKGDAAVHDSEVVLIEIDNLSKIGWHNGGGLAFGADGKLYLSTGENAKDTNAQDPGNLLGKLMRWNKDGSIPTDNPYYDEFAGKNRAIVALGLRNPFSIAVQPGTGKLYISMVGAQFEQIERYETASAPVRVNYGWPKIDGPPRNQELPADYRAPEYPYDHGIGKGLALCGGDFYNPAHPGNDAFPAQYTGKFFFGDYGGWIKYIDPAQPSVRHDFADGINRALDIATAPDGSLWYIERAGIPGGSDEANSASHNGSLWRVRWIGGDQDVELAQKPVDRNARLVLKGINLPANSEGAMPATLSATGIFTDNALTPRAGFVPYTLNSTIWVDGADIQRWVMLPEGKKIGFSPANEFTWPGGALFVQQLNIATNKSDANKRRLETRVLVLDDTGKFGYGATYRWRADGSDADLVKAEGEEEVLKTQDAHGVAHEQTWTYPSRGACILCHTPNAGFVLGPKARQLNGDFTYPNGTSANQLRKWNTMGMFTTKLDEGSLAALPHTVKSDDARASVDDRMRSYLDGNCANCHRPGGTGAQWDARFETPLSKQGIFYGGVRNNLGIDDLKIATPGDVHKSSMFIRLNSTELATQMPPVTRNVPDARAIELLRQWINTSTNIPRPDPNTTQPIEQFE
ncbi:hypothetical protein GC207_05965 [bacterium]|nr:hypothetical protein [bacterium]